MIWKKRYTMRENDAYYGSWGLSECKDCNRAVAEEAGRGQELKSVTLKCGCGREVLRDPTEGLNIF